MAKEIKPSPAFAAAIELVGMDPLPADAEARMSALEKQIRDDEAARFGDLWEALIAALPNGPSGE